MEQNKTENQTQLNMCQDNTIRVQIKKIRRWFIRFNVKDLECSHSNQFRVFLVVGHFDGNIPSRGHFEVDTFAIFYALNLRHLSIP